MTASVRLRVSRASRLAGVLAVWACSGIAAGQIVDTSELRAVQPLIDGWSFVQDDELTDQEALAAATATWQSVTLPHSWNAEDAASLDAEGYERGLGWYRLELETPAAGARHWLEIGAASLVADVWLNGQHLGQHRGGFTQFRFDVTDVLAESGPNTLLVKVDNNNPNSDDDATAIDPFGGDYNKSGGLHRHVALISTADTVHFDLGDMGGPGVHAATTSVAETSATVNVRAKLTSASAAEGDYLVRISLADADGVSVGSAEQPAQLLVDEVVEVALDLEVANPRLWQGKADPHLYQLVAELLGPDGSPLDRVVQSFGIREMRFDPSEGFFLNGEHLRLNGVAMHQDYLGKSFAMSHEDMEESLSLIMELGANAIRLGHYPFDEYVLQRMSELGLVAWSEKPSGLRTTIDQCTTTDPTEEYMANAREQLQELIRQQYNHAAVGLWSIGNETEAGQSGCDEEYDNVTPYLQELHALAKEEDPYRPTVNAEFTQGLDGGTGIFGDVPFTTAGITDVLATNRYYLWYALEFEEFSPLLDTIHERYPDQPLGVSEYGAGGALTHHTDNPRGGPPEVRSAPDGEVSYQPEEYQAYVHEEVYRLLSSKPYLWGTFVWNMFDFGSDHRNEGDVLGVNTKGLVTFDRQTRKDAYYFYKANWSSEPVTYIVGRRYTDRAYPVADVKVYSNADSVELSVNDVPFASLTADRCEQKTCVFEDVPLTSGVNTVTAVGTHGAEFVTDSVEWSRDTNGVVAIAAGRLTTGYVSTQDTHFGSDHFFSGGTGAYIDLGEDAAGGDPNVSGTNDPQLYKYFRHGEFSYDIPLADGAYELTLGFIEPDDDIAVGDRVFSVLANGEPLLEDYDVLQEAGEDWSVVTETFTLQVAGGSLALAFTPTQGEALVSSIRITPQAAAIPAAP